jgi:aminopeptidase C
LLGIPSAYQSFRTYAYYRREAVGFDDTTDGEFSEHFIFRNSWGDDWGDDGYGYMPYAYVAQHGIRACFVLPFR